MTEENGYHCGMTSSVDSMASAACSLLPIKILLISVIISAIEGARENIDFRIFPFPFACVLLSLFLFYYFFFINLITLEFLKFPHVSVLENQPSRAQLLTEFNQPHSKSIPSNLLVI